MSALWDFHKLSEKEKKPKQFEVLLVAESLRGAFASTLMIRADYLRHSACFANAFKSYQSNIYLHSNSEFVLILVLVMTFTRFLFSLSCTPCILLARYSLYQH